MYEINPEYFKKVKVKILSWMFRGIGGKDSIYGDVRHYGVIVPIFVVQIIGIVLAILQIILIPFLYILVPIENVLIIVIGSMFGIYILTFIIVITVCICLSRYHDK